MKPAMTARYDRFAILLHWSIALLIGAAFLLGLTVDDFPRAYKDQVVNVHGLAGLAVLALTLGRIAWRTGHRPPPPPAMSDLMRAGSKLVHLLLYALMLAVSAIGIPALFYRGRGIDFGFFQVPVLAARTPEIFRPLTELHEWAAYALVGLAAAHIAAAIYHQMVLRDGLVTRMIPEGAGS